MGNHGRDINHVGPFNFKDLIAQLVSDFPIFFAFEAFRLGVRQRCEWIQVPVPSDEELRRRFQHWLENNYRFLEEYDISA